VAEFLDGRNRFARRRRALRTAVGRSENQDIPRGRRQRAVVCRAFRLASSRRSRKRVSTLECRTRPHPRRCGETARREGTVEDGIDVVRPALRDTLIGALTQGGSSAESVEDLLDSGGWTDDRVAASVLSEHVDPPDRSIRTRLEAWLFPERVVRRRARRATEAVAVAAEAALPTVPGQTAPRTVPTVTTSLSELQRGVDGRLQRASDPMAIARGPSPPEASTDEEDSE